MTSLSASTFADEGKNVGSVQVPDGYVEQGDFYWTRLYWKGSADVLNHGSLYFIESDGTRSTTNIWLVVGLKATAEAVKKDAGEGWDALKQYQKPAELLPNKKDAVTLKDAFLNLFIKPWGLLTHKVGKAKKRTEENWDSFGNSNLDNWGPAGKALGYAWNGLGLVLDPVMIVGVEMPLELGLRIVPKYTVGVLPQWNENSLMWSVVRPTLRPVAPVLATGIHWGVEVPLDVALGGVPSVAAGSVGLVLTGVTATLEGTKFLVWDVWQDRSAENSEASAYLPVPHNEKVEKELDSVFASFNKESMNDLEAVISSVDSKDQWIVMANIVSRLEETIKSLEQVTDEKVSRERELLSNLKIVYSIDLEDKVAQQIAEPTAN
ncbi:MAG: hypothetical protein HYY62_01080 [Deltaproteobacteria bacterium]|nr:hypothetical protein [Deltaproteobacteria bacterium]